jgi:pimeloyl-ACP methyl ester carboxylesterase
MGGLLGVVLASQRPKRLGSLILNDVGPTLPWSGVFSLMTGLGSAKSSQRADIDGVALAEKLRVDPNLLRAVRQPAHLDLAHETRLSGVDFSPTFAAVTVPMLLLRGMESEIINDRVVKRIFELHPLTRIHECKKSGHPVLYSKTVTEAILKFVKSY